MIRVSFIVISWHVIVTELLTYAAGTGFFFSFDEFVKQLFVGSLDITCYIPNHQNREIKLPIMC